MKKKKNQLVKQVKEKIDNGEDVDTEDIAA